MLTQWIIPIIIFVVVYRAAKWRLRRKKSGA